MLRELIAYDSLGPRFLEIGGTTVFTFYNLFLFIHIVSIVIWLGGLATLVILDLQLAREPEAAGIAALSRAGEFFGRAVVGPVAGIAVLAGIAMVLDSHKSFATLWILWGITGVAASIAFGATMIRSTRERLDDASRTVAGDTERFDALRTKMLRLQVINLVLLVSVVFAMVFKPVI